MTKYAQGAIPHGTVNGYQNYRCRCFHCREAFRIYFRGQRDRRIERGICVECGEPAGDTTRCEKHRARLAAGRRKCQCGHCASHHRTACVKCACAGFQQAERKKRETQRTTQLHPLTAERQALIAERNRVRNQRIRERWLVRYPEVDPAIAMKIYREGYQAGHQVARETAAKKLSLIAS